MAYVNIDSVPDYYLPKMSIESIIVQNSAGRDILLRIKYKMKSPSSKTSPSLGVNISQYIRPYVVAFPNRRLATIYENYLKSDSSQLLENLPNSMFVFDNVYDGNTSNCFWYPDGTIQNTLSGTGYSHDTQAGFISRINTLRSLEAWSGAKYAISDPFPGVLGYDGMNPVRNVAFRFGDFDAFNENPSATPADKNVRVKMYTDDMTIPIDESDGSTIELIVENIENQSSTEYESTYVQIYLYYFAYLDLEGVLNDTDIMSNEAASLAFNDIIINASFGRRNRKYLHGSVGKQLILHGEYDESKPHDGIGVARDTLIFKTADGTNQYVLDDNLKIFRHNKRYYGTDRTGISEQQLKSTVQSNPTLDGVDSIIPLVTERIQNSLVVDQRGTAFIGLNNGVSNPPPPIVDPYRMRNGIPSPNVYSKINDLFNHIGGQDIVGGYSGEGLFFSQQKFLKHKSENNKGKFHPCAFFTPSARNNSVQFHAVFNQLDILKANSRMYPVIQKLAQIQNHSEDSQSFEESLRYYMKSRDMMRIRSAKVLRQKVSNTYDKINTFGTYTGKTELKNETSFDKYNVEVLCESSEKSSRDSWERQMFFSTSDREAYFGPDELLHPILNFGAILRDDRTLMPSNFPKVRIFHIEDFSIFRKQIGNYQYGLEIEYEDPYHKFIADLINKLNAAIYFVDKVIEYLEKGVPSVSTYQTELDQLFYRTPGYFRQGYSRGDGNFVNTEVQRIIAKYRSLVALVEPEAAATARTLDNDYMSDTERREFSTMYAPYVRDITGNNQTIGTIFKTLTAQVLTESIATLAAVSNKPCDVTGREIDNITMQTVGSMSYYSRLSTTLKSLLSSIGKIYGGTHSKNMSQNVESKYNADDRLNPGSNYIKNTFTVKSLIKNTHGRDHHVNLNEFRSPSMTSLESMISNLIQNETPASVREAVYTQDSIRQLLTKEEEKFRPYVRYPAEHFSDKIFSITPDFYTVKDPDSGIHRTMPLFADDSDPLSTYYLLTATNAREGYLEFQGNLSKQRANAFLMMLGIFHYLTHIERTSSENAAHANGVGNDFAGHYNHLLDLYDVSELVTTMDSHLAYREQGSGGANPIVFDTVHGFGDSPPMVPMRSERSLFDGVQGGDFQLPGGERIPIDTAVNDRFGRGPTLYAPTHQGYQFRRRIVKDFLEYVKREDLDFMDFNFFRYARRMEESDNDHYIYSLLNTMINSLNSNIADREGAYETIAPGILNMNFLEMGRGTDPISGLNPSANLFLNPIIYGEVKYLQKLELAFENSRVGPRIQNPEYNIDGVVGDNSRYVTVGEVLNGLEPGLYVFVSPDINSFSSSLKYSAPFRVAGPNEERTNLVGQSSGIFYTYGGEYKYAQDHPTNPGKDYVGYYHLHDGANGRIVMEGAIHTDQPHATLVRVGLNTAEAQPIYTGDVFLPMDARTRRTEENTSGTALGTGGVVSYGEQTNLGAGSSY